MRSPVSSRRALSLAETIVAGSLLSILLISVFNLFPSALTTVEFSRQQTAAHTLAHDSLEQFAAKPFSTLQPGPQVTTALVVPTGFTLTVDVGQLTQYPPEFLKTITATVSWKYRGRDRTVRQELYVHPAKN